jgi:SAM-dependent methyltransferase
LSITRKDILTINQKGWNIVAPQFYGGTALPRYGPLAVTEDQVHLLDDLKGKAILELGCGSGHTLQYLWKEKQAGELWGLDMSQEQPRFTSELLAQDNIPARLFLSSMDENPGIPELHFDLVMSIYGLGWIPNLSRTLLLIYSYLKPDGIFIFSWEHPVYQCLEYDPDSGRYFLDHSYLDESPERKPSWRGVEIVLRPRMLSTYVNAICDAGFRIERLVESEPNLNLAREQDYDPGNWYSAPRARLIPTTLIVKASRPTK